jgi:hypothetical protein
MSSPVQIPVNRQLLEDLISDLDENTSVIIKLIPDNNAESHIRDDGALELRCCKGGMMCPLTP